MSIGRLRRVTDPISQLRADLTLMEEYLRTRVRLRDWHGVMDAAADIREIEAKISVLETMPPPFDG